MGIERLTLVLDSAEAAALRSAARAEMRRPRDQARYLLRSVLLGESTSGASTTNSNSAGRVLADSGAVAPEQSR